MSNQIGFDELLKEYKELLEENEKLRIENEKLKKLLEEINNNSSSFIKSSTLSDSLAAAAEEEASISTFPENDSINFIEGILPFSENDSHFICRKCHKIPVIEFNSLKTFNFSCICFKYQNISLEDIIISYILFSLVNLMN